MYWITEIIRHDLGALDETTFWEVCAAVLETLSNWIWNFNWLGTWLLCLPFPRGVDDLDMDIESGHEVIHNTLLGLEGNSSHAELSLIRVLLTLDRWKQSTAVIRHLFGYSLVVKYKDIIRLTTTPMPSLPLPLPLKPSNQLLSASILTPPICQLWFFHRNPT